MRRRVAVFATSHAWTVALTSVIGLAIAVRAGHILNAPFPLNDGGLFFVMAENLQDAGYRLPETTSYNGDALPFAYPPLGLYLAALLDDLTPLALVDVFRVLPLAASCLVVAACYLLARVLLRDRWAALLAALAFSLAPRSFIWLAMGGGVTRAPALACALVALALFYRALTERERGMRHWGPLLGAAAVLGGITAATHLETAAFLAASLAVFSVAGSGPRDGKGAGQLAGQAWWRQPFHASLCVAVVGLGSAVLSAPWWGTVIARHGLDPFRAAMAQGGTLLASGDVPEGVWLRLANPSFTSEPYFPLIAALGVIGGLHALVRGRMLLPLWLAVIVIMHMRAFQTFAVVPTALLAGVALRWTIEAAWRPVSDSGDAPTGARASVSRATVSRATSMRLGIVAAVVLAISVAGAVTNTRGESTFLHSLTPAESEAMTWVAASLPADATVLVVPRHSWYADRHGEWFPALTGRVSVATPQGYEWVPDEFGRRVSLHQQVRGCATDTVQCVERLRAVADFAYVFVPAGCCEPLRRSLASDAHYEVAYNSKGVLVAHHLDATASSTARRAAP